MIINLTQHRATPGQLAAGVEDLPAEQRAELIHLLTFDAPPDRREIMGRAMHIARLAARTNAAAAMIGGAPYLMAPLERELYTHAIRPMYAFSARESIEETMPDGSVRKTQIFRHSGFVGSW